MTGYSTNSVDRAILHREDGDIEIRDLSREACLLCGSWVSTHQCHVVGEEPGPTLLEDAKTLTDYCDRQWLPEPARSAHRRLAERVR